jgi:hypothetical protein
LLQWKRILGGLGIGLLAAACTAQSTWYVRKDGGTRHSANMPQGQCDGLADAPYPGKGSNQHCAFNDYRLLYQDGSYAVNTTPFPSWGWLIQAGDTVLLRGSIGDDVTYRVGWPSPSGCMDQQVHAARGLCGDPYAAPPPVPSGTAGHPTRILGEHYAACQTPQARTQLHGGYGANAVLNLKGSSYVEVRCLDITDFAACGRAGQHNTCSAELRTLDDYATNGILWSNQSTHDTLADVRVHGVANAGMLGPTGDGTVMHDIALIGNASSGWNADRSDSQTGTGTLRVDHFNISWNGCAEEYPIRHALPYNDCVDDNSGGYGDGFGTASVDSVGGWDVVFDTGVASYNTQDGLDALHLTGKGSSMTVLHTQAYGNMGQQLKVGGTAGNMTGNLVYTNCNAMRSRIPGTPEGYNRRLTDFCRAADEGLVLSVANHSTAVFEDNIVMSASATGLEVAASGACDDATCLIRQRHNIFVGFRNDIKNGYPGGGSGLFSNPVYPTDSERAYRNRGSSFDGNITYHASSEWECPNVSLHETHAHCGNPYLADQSWQLYGIADASPTSRTSFAPNSGSTGSHLRHMSLRAGHLRLRWKALGTMTALVGGWGLWRLVRADRG